VQPIIKQRIHVKEVQIRVQHPTIGALLQESLVDMLEKDDWRLSSVCHIGQSIEPLQQLICVVDG